MRTIKYLSTAVKHPLLDAGRTIVIQIKTVDKYCTLISLLVCYEPLVKCVNQNCKTGLNSKYCHILVWFRCIKQVKSRTC